MADIPINMHFIDLSTTPRKKMTPLLRLRRVGLSRLNRIRNSAARAVYRMSTTASIQLVSGADCG